MNDFITISCPSCGGQLRRGANTTTYTCDYCGQQHRLRVEDIEEFGRCPICHRNDKVEKVRAIYNKGGNLASLLAPPNDPISAFTYSPPTKPANLNKPVIEPLKGKITKFSSKFFLLGGLTLSTILFFIMINFRKDNNSVEKGFSILVILFAIFILLYIVFLFIGEAEDKKLNAEHKHVLLSAWEKQNQEIESKWSADTEKYDAAYQQKFSQLAKKHQSIMQRYDTLYYCHRDDCVFFPGESGNAPSAKIEEFLNQESKSISR